MLNANRFAALTAKSAFIISILCLLGVFLSGPIYRLELWSLGIAFSVLKWSVYLCSGAAILAIINLVLNKLSRQTLFNRSNVLALIFSLLAIGVPYLYVYEFEKIDTVADITTDLQNPPVFVNLVPIREQTARNPLAYRGGDATEAQLQYFPELRGLKIKASIENVIKQAKAITLEAGFELVAAVPAEGRLEATETSFWFGFKDDVVIRARALDNGETLVDIRSASRVGYGDGGVNGKRVLMYLNELEKRLNH